ncbi:MAG: class I SAM-dependent methyltransferase [Planctomycetota bacterium]
MPTPYDDAALYDRLFDGLTFDVDFYHRLAIEAGGPALDVGCGTGRVLLPLWDRGLSVDGWEPSPAMLARLRAKALAAGHAPRLFGGDLGALPETPRYGLAFFAFNAFAHNLTSQSQLDILRRLRTCLHERGCLAIGAGHPPFSDWAAPTVDPSPVLEMETTPDANGLRLRLLDTRRLDPIGLIQHSTITIEEVDSYGVVVAAHQSTTTLRWLFQPEFELLLRCAGFQRVEFFGGYDGEARVSDAQPLIVVAR